MCRRFVADLGSGVEVSDAGLTGTGRFRALKLRGSFRMLLSLGSPVVPFALFVGSSFSYKVANPKQGALIMTWLLGYQVGLAGLGLDFGFMKAKMSQIPSQREPLAPRRYRDPQGQRRPQSPPILEP